MLSRRSWGVALLLSSFALLTAMGGGGGGGFERAPRVEKNYSVVVTDLSGNTLKGERFSCEGRLHFTGYQGMAQVSVPFDRVSTLTFGDKRERKVKVTARLRDGSETSFEIEANSRLSGDTSFGSFQLRADEVKTIAFP